MICFSNWCMTEQHMLGSCFLPPLVYHPCLHSYGLECAASRTVHSIPTSPHFQGPEQHRHRQPPGLGAAGWKCLHWSAGTCWGAGLGWGRGLSTIQGDILIHSFPLPSPPPDTAYPGRRGGPHVAAVLQGDLLIRSSPLRPPHTACPGHRGRPHASAIRARPHPTPAVRRLLQVSGGWGEASEGGEGAGQGAKGW